MLSYAPRKERNGSPTALAGYVPIGFFNYLRQYYKVSGGKYSSTCSFLPLGISMGIAMGYMGIGPAIGLSVGVAIGAALEKKHAHELRPLTKKEEKFRNINMLCLGIFAVFGVIVFLIVAFF